MSTLSSHYPDAIQVRRVTASARILVLIGLALTAILVLALVRSAANGDLSSRAAISQNSSVPAAVPVPTPSITEIHPVPAETAVPQPGETGGLSAIPVPVPTPPEP